MSKTSTSGSKNPSQLSSKSAWARGPPSASASAAQSPRSQSPAPTTPTTAPSHQGGHSRKPSALGQSVPFKDGVSIPRNNVGSAKQSPSVTFGSINEPTAPVSSSPAAVPSIKTESVKSFGTLPATPSQLNGKPPVSSAASTSSSSTKVSTSSTPPSTVPSTSSTPPASTPPTPVKQKPKMDVRSLFKGPSASTPVQQESNSPSTRNTPLPTQPPPPSNHAPATTTPTQPGSHPPPFVPRGAQVPNGPNGGPPQPPRSPVYNRHPQNGTGGRPGSSPAAAGQPPMGSPRMAPSQHAQVPPAGMPPQQWPYGYYDPNYPIAYHPQWYMPPQPLPHHHHPPPNGPPGPQHSGMPMSPRNAPPSLPPGTPQPAHAVPASPHIPHATPSHSHSGSMSSPPAPSPGNSAANAANRLNTNASTFVPTNRRVTIKSSDGTEIKLPDLRKTSPAPVVPPSPNADFTATASPARKSIVRIESQAEKEKRLEEEKARLAKEEQAKQEQAKVKEQAEREKEEKAKKAEEEKERLRLEAEQRKKDEEEKARKAKEEEERLRLESEQKKKEEERLKQEAEKKKAEEEAARKKKEEEEAHRQKEAERKEAEAAKEAEVKATNAAPPSKESLEDGEVTEDASSKDAANATAKEGLRINTNSSMPPPTELPRRRPGPLDLSYTAKQPIAPPLPSALATARHIDDLGAVPYPDGVLSPKVELNANAQPGKYRYDRDFLLQFMSVCKEKPESLPPLDAIGIESSDQNFSLSRGGSGRHRTSSTAGPSRQNSVGLGSFGKQQFPTMGSFGTAPKTSEERFMASSNRSISVSGAGAVPPFGRPAMARTASQGGPSQLGTNRTRSRRGEKRGDGNKGPGVGQPSQLNPASNAGLMLEPVAPLEKSQNAWAPASVGRKPTAVDADSPAVVDRKVKSLLNKLTMEKFESISDQIIEWANRSEKEKDGRTLIQVIRLVFEKATDEATWSEMYARLCRKMMERISPEVKDDGIKNSEGKPIAGGNLFRKYLLNRCQEDFERGWAAKDAAASAAASKAASDKAIQESTAAKKTEGGEDEIALYSDEYYAAQKAKRRGLGLIKFIGELFKLQMLTERIMHECVQKLLRNVDNPEEEEIESLCKLLSTVGGMLDANTKARTHMDVYFTRMKELAKGSQVSSRMQFMLQDVIELRERKWVARNQVAAPATIAQVHEAAAKEKQAQEKESYNRTMSMSRGGSKRGMDRGEAGADGWTVQGGGAPPARPPSKAGDLSQFGKIGATKGTPMTFGPSSVFNKKDTKRESITRTGSSSNMFQMLQNAENAPEPSSLSKSSRPPSRKPSMDLGQAGVPEPATQRRKIILQPRTKPAEGTTTPQESRPPSPEEEPQAEMSEADAKRKLSEDLKEFKSVRNLDEAEDYFISLPHTHHALLVEQFVSFAVESKETDAQLVADLFARAVNKSLCSPSAFEEGFGLVSEFISDVAIDAPKAPNYFALMVKASGLGDEERTRVAQKSADYGDKLTELFA